MGYRQWGTHLQILGQGFRLVFPASCTKTIKTKSLFWQFHLPKVASPWLQMLPPAPRLPSSQSTRFYRCLNPFEILSLKLCFSSSLFSSLEAKRSVPGVLESNSSFWKCLVPPARGGSKQTPVSDASPKKYVFLFLINYTMFPYAHCIGDGFWKCHTSK